MSTKKKIAGLAALKGAGQLTEPQPLTPVEHSNGQTHKKQKPKSFPLLLHPAVHEVLRTMAFNEKVSMTKHVYEGIDLLFKKKGIASIKEIIRQDETK